MLALTTGLATALVLPTQPRAMHAPRAAAVRMAESVQLDTSVLAKYMALPADKQKVQAEYLWIDAVGNVRSKCRTVKASDAKMCPRSVSNHRPASPHSPLHSPLARAARAFPPLDSPLTRAAPAPSR